MGISEKDKEKALQVKDAVNEFFKISREKEVQAKELMDLFIKKGIFNKNHRDGLPIRQLLRDLEKSGQLHLIPQVQYEQKAKNKNWFFVKLKE